MIFKNYIIKIWYKFFFSSFIIITFLLLTINLLAEIMRGEASLFDSFLFRFLEMADWQTKVIPIAALIASLGCFYTLIQKNELIAILTAGLTIRKTMVLILVASIVPAFFLFTNDNFLSPWSKRLRYELYNEKVHFRGNEAKNITSSIDKSGLTWLKSDGYFVSYSSFDEDRQELANLKIIYINSNDKLSAIVSSPLAKFIAENDIELQKSYTITRLNGDGFPEAENLERKIITLNETSKDFKIMNEKASFIDSFTQALYLNRLEELNVDVKGQKRVVYQKLFSFLSVIIFSLWGMTIVQTPHRRFFGKNKKQFIILLVFPLGYWAADSAFQQIIPGVPLLVSVLLAPMFCFIFLANKFLRLNTRAH